jgi:hypothetical protein
MAAIASSITVKELRQKARDLNIKDWYKLKKEDLLRAVADFKIMVPEVDVPPKLEMEKDATPFNATDIEEATNSPKRTVSWIILIGCVITIPLFAWWISQADPWYQQVLEFFKF